MHRLVKGTQQLVVDGTVDRDTVRAIARTTLGVGTTVLYKNQVHCDDCGDIFEQLKDFIIE